MLCPRGAKEARVFPKDEVGGSNPSGDAMQKKVIGLTGGIASGKSTVGKIFTELGVSVIDADQLARDVVKPGSEALQELASAFGASYLQEDGNLDRAKLGTLIFSQPESRKVLDRIMHGRIHQLFEQRVRVLQDHQSPYILYEAALLVELGIFKSLDGLIVVSAAPDLQVRRVMKRNQITESEARDRLASQYPLDKKTAVATHIILNDNDRDALRVRVEALHQKLLAQL